MRVGAYRNEKAFQNRGVGNGSILDRCADFQLFVCIGTAFGLFRQIELKMKEEPEGGFVYGDVVQIEEKELG